MKTKVVLKGAELMDEGELVKEKVLRKKEENEKDRLMERLICRRKRKLFYEVER